MNLVAMMDDVMIRGVVYGERNLLRVVAAAGGLVLLIVDLGAAAVVTMRMIWNGSMIAV